ncbi:MAG: adenylyltransferase/cytidyltransferase family protein [Candidatus Micrarchaeota archaeon]|nr:adenylyltransferase/cytidyltransferase family protein [Candidatus Micrarchaeota archaeon]
MLRKSGKRKTVVLAGGIFDILHRGHIHFLEHAKSLGDELVVVIGTDANARKSGKNPIHNEKDRLAVVSALSVVDRALIGSNKSMLSTIRKANPSIIFLGYDQQLPPHMLDYCEKKGIKVLRDSCTLNPRRYKTTIIKRRIVKGNGQSRADRLFSLAGLNARRCPWCKERTPDEYVKALESEVNEVKDAIAKRDYRNLKEELGDVVWDALVLAHICEKEGLFKGDDVLEGIIRKIERRKPWLASGKKVTIEEAAKIWEEAKRREKENA